MLAGLRTTGETDRICPWVGYNLVADDWTGAGHQILVPGMTWALAQNRIHAISDLLELCDFRRHTPDAAQTHRTF